MIEGAPQRGGFCTSNSPPTTNCQMAIVGTRSFDLNSLVHSVGKGLAPAPVTDGHVDGSCAFVGPASVMLHTTDDRNDLNYRICRDANHRLQQATDARGRKLGIIEAPLDGDVSYLNFYIANGASLVPITGDRTQDRRPMGVMKEVFGDEYKVIGIDSNVLGQGGGGIHCIIQQVPKV